jgi:hypothetical protein
LSLILFESEGKDKKDFLENVENNLQEVFNNMKSFKEDEDYIEKINVLIKIIGTDSEVEETIPIISRFGISIYIASELFEGITWEEITSAYKKKSKINIERQKTNY